MCLEVNIPLKSKTNSINSVQHTLYLNLWNIEMLVLSIYYKFSKGNFTINLNTTNTEFDDY